MGSWCHVFLVVLPGGVWWRSFLFPCQSTPRSRAWRGGCRLPLPPESVCLDQAAARRYDWERDDQQGGPNTGSNRPSETRDAFVCLLGFEVGMDSERLIEVWPYRCSRRRMARARRAATETPARGSSGPWPGSS